MAGNLLRIVDAIGPTPTVLLDLNDEIMFACSSFQAPPPQLVRTAIQTQAQDGSVDPGSVYGDRVIDLDLDLYVATQDTSATQLQLLARLLSDPRGQWLMYQPIGATKAVFFKLRRGDITSILDVIASTAMRELHLTLPAYSFAIGESVSSTATVNNDPTAGSNPMSFVMPTVLGDVPAPLMMAMQSINTCMIASCAALSAPSTPLFTHTINSEQTVAGWNASVTTADTDAIGTGNNVIALVKTSGALTKSMTFSFAAVPLGDYRLLVRIKTSTAGVSIAGHRAGTALPSARPITGDGLYHYYDFGVVRMPVSRPQPNPPGITTLGPATATAELIFAAAGATGTILIDELVLVPAGLDDAVSSRILIGGGNTDMGPTNLLPVNVDSMTRSLWQGNASAYNPIPVVGAGFPMVAPAVKNVITIIRSISALTGYYDIKTANYVVTWMYYPQYLYVRPATT
jgi:hypothetical protein